MVDIVLRYAAVAGGVGYDVAVAVGAELNLCPFEVDDVILPMVKV